MEPISQRQILIGMDRSLPLTITRLLVTGFTVMTIYGVLTFAKACDPDGANVVCGAASRAVFISGIIACGIALALDLVGNPLIRCLMDMVIALIGLFAAIAPGRIFPLCADATSRCNTDLHHFALVMGMLLFVMANIDSIVTFRYAMRIARQAVYQQTSSASRHETQAQGTRYASSPMGGSSSSVNSSKSSNSNKSKYKG